MELFIVIILLVIGMIIFGLIMRKRVYDRVDQLEDWKLEMMNRNIAHELGQIKGLNLSGDTQEKFEIWKAQWERIVTHKLPDVEEYLFDAETAADRYRFSTAKKNLRAIEDILESSEREIESILTELDTLLETEETSRKDIEQLEPNIRSLRQTVLNNRYQYGKADARLEVLIDDAAEGLETYHDLVEQGNYFEAQQHVDSLKKDVEELKQIINDLPEILKQCKRELPAQLDDLYTGLKEMKADGYRIDHLGFEKDIQNMHQQLREGLESLEKAKIADVRTLLAKTEERIKEMYDLLEKEAIARHYVETKFPTYDQMFDELDKDFTQTQSEVETLREAYHFDESDMERYLNLEKSINRIRQEMETFAREANTFSHGELREKLEKGMANIESLDTHHDDFKEKIRALRKDELEAKAAIQEMKERIHGVHRILLKSNIPGIPVFIWNLLDEAMQKNNDVLSALDRYPLDMKEVQRALGQAHEKVEQTAEQTDFILDQAYLTEHVIQYANRYRSQNSVLAAELKEAERLFRAYDYELALEKAATALEKVDPDALKKIEPRVDKLEVISR